MTNSEVFFYPGQVGTAFVLSLFDAHPGQLDAGVVWLLNVICALLIWVWCLRIVVAVTKKIFGFDRQGRAR